MRMSSWAASWTLSATLLLSACAVGPDFRKPQAPETGRYTSKPLPAATASSPGEAGQAQRFVPSADIPEAWWTSFHNEALNGLIAEAFKSNPDLAAARAALRVALEDAKAQEGAYYPSLSANFSASRNANSMPLSPTLSSGQLLFDLYQTELNANWTLDIWGGNRRAVEALDAQAEAERFQLESVRLALAANVVADAVQEASLRAQIAATNDIIKAETESLAILRHQEELGQIAGADVAAQEATLAQAEQALPPLQKQLAQVHDALAALVGKLPSDGLPVNFSLSDLSLPEEIPLGVPAKLVEQRPDIRVAQANLHAASAQVGVAVANMLPNITIGAGAGSVATQFSDLLTPGGGFWSVAGGVTQPLFEGGTLFHKTRAARAALDQAAAQYRSAVVSAFQNVADTLQALQADADALKAATTSEQAASDSLAITHRQLEFGAVGYLALLNAEQTYQQAVIARIQAEAARYADTAALFQALGGGWWNRRGADEEEAKNRQSCDPASPCGN